MGWRVVGHREPIRVRDDSSWNVPEPELTLVVNARREIVGYCAGNDVSSRDIEGENPLYLPQAKVYDGSCALGPGHPARRSRTPSATCRSAWTWFATAGSAFTGDTQTCR